MQCARVRTPKAHMPQHIAPSWLTLSQGAQLRSCRSWLGFIDISRIQGIGCKEAPPPPPGTKDSMIV